MARLGVSKIRVTGGEPLVRKDIVKLVASLSKIPHLDDLSLTTNGILLSKYAKELKESGLKRINVSLDTLNDAKFKTITRGGELCEVLRGIDEAKRLGFFVKLNVVAMRGINTDEILDFVRFGIEEDIIVRFIEFMPKGEKEFWSSQRYISAQEIIKTINPADSLVPVEGIRGNGPARYFRIKGSDSVIGFISALSCKFCAQCNRIRLTADGFLLSCLAYNYGINLKDILRNDNDPEYIVEVIKKVVYLKPKEHTMGSSNIYGYNMSEVGG
jgi:cyclic pyranopterin phosphate synthase